MSKLRTIIAAVAAGIAFQFVFAANTASEKVGDYTWSYSVVDGKAVIGVVDENGYPKGHQRAIEPEPVGAVEIPSTLGGCPVTEIGDYAFYSCKRMTALTFPSGVVRIGRFAISYQGGMTGIDLPDGLTEIAADAFFNCHGLTSVVIPSGVTNVGSSAFAFCYKLKSVTIPGSVQTLGDGVFSACCVLDAFVVDETNPCCKVVDGCLLTKDGKTLLRGPASERVVVPSCVEEVSGEAFFWCGNLRSVTFQEGVQTIGPNVFTWCDDLQTVFFPSTVTHIDEGIFRGCSQLSTIRVAEGNARYKCEDGFLLTKDGTVLLRAENMTAAVVPEGVIRLGGDCFSGSECLASVTLPEGLAEIGPDAFFRTGVKSLVIPATVNVIGETAFDEAPLSAVYFRGNAPECGEYIYSGVPDVVSYVLPGSTGWNGTPGSTDLPELWPVGDESARPIVFWSAGVTHTVTFDLGEHGTHTGGGALTQTVKDGEAAVAPTFDVADGWKFQGWDRAFAKVTANLTVSAKYEQAQPGRGTGSDLYPPGKDKPFTGDAAATYDGYLLDAGGVVVGTISVKTAKVRVDRKTGAKTSAVTATVYELGQKKRTMKGTLDLATGKTSYKVSPAPELVIGRDSIAGTYGYDGRDCTVVGARNFFTAKPAEKGDVLAKFNGRTYTVALKTSDGGGNAFANGHSTFSVAVGARGKVKTTGVLADGTKVRVTGQLLVGAGGACRVPVFAQLYSGKRGGFGFLLLLDAAHPASAAVGSLSCLDGTGAKPAGFRAAWSAKAVGEQALLGSGSLFNLEDVWEDVNGAEPRKELLPRNESVVQSGAKWIVAKAGKVKLERSGSLAYDAKANPSGLKLTYTSKSGLFKGSFSVYTLVNGKLKKVSATVSGAMVGGAGYGTAMIKKVGSVPVVVNRTRVASGSETPPSQDERLASALAYGYVDDSSEETGNSKWPIKRGLWAVTRGANGSCVLEIDSAFGKATFRGAALDDLCDGTSRQYREVVLTGSGGETLTLSRRFDLAWYFTDYAGSVTGGIFGSRELDVNGACDRFGAQQDAAVKAGVKAYVDVVAGTYRLKVSERPESERQTMYGYYPYNYSVSAADDASDADLSLTVARDGTASVSGTMGGAAVSGTTRLLFWTAADYANAIFWIRLADGREAVLFISFYSAGETRVYGDGMIQTTPQTEPAVPVEPWPFTPADPQPDPPAVTTRVSTVSAYGFLADVTDEGSDDYPMDRGTWTMSVTPEGQMVFRISSYLGDVSFDESGMSSFCDIMSGSSASAELEGVLGERLVLRRKGNSDWYENSLDGTVTGGIFGSRQLTVYGRYDYSPDYIPADMISSMNECLSEAVGVYSLKVWSDPDEGSNHPNGFIIEPVESGSADLTLRVNGDGTASLTGEDFLGAADGMTTKVLFRGGESSYYWNGLCTPVAVFYIANLSNDIEGELRFDVLKRGVVRGEGWNRSR